MPNYEQSSHQKNTERMPGSSRRDQRRTTDYTRSQRRDLPPATTGRRPRDGGNPGSSWSSASNWEQLPRTVQQRLFPLDQHPYAPPTIPPGEVGASPANPWTAFGSFPRDWRPPSHSTEPAGHSEGGTATEMDAAIAQLQHQQRQDLSRDYARDLSAAMAGQSYLTPAQVEAQYKSQWDRMQQTYPAGQASQPGFVPADAPGSGQPSHAQPFSSATEGAWVSSSEGTAPGHSSSALPSWHGETFSEAGWSAFQPSEHAPAESFFSAALPGEGDRGTLADSSLNEGMATTSLTEPRTESREVDSLLFQRVTLQRDPDSQLLDEASRTWLDEAFPGYHEALFHEVMYDGFTAIGRRLWSEFCQMEQWRLEDYDAQLRPLENDRAQSRTRNQRIANEVQKLENKIKELEKRKGVSPLDKEIKQQIREHKLSQNRLKSTRVEPQKIEQVEKEIATIHQQQVAWEVVYETLSSRPDPQQLPKMLEEGQKEVQEKAQKEANPTKRARKLRYAGEREKLKAYRQLDKERMGISHSRVEHYMDELKKHAIQSSEQTPGGEISFPIGPIKRFIREYYRVTKISLSGINRDAKKANTPFPVYFHLVKKEFEKKHPHLLAQPTGSQKREIEIISAEKMNKKAEKMKRRKQASESRRRVRAKDETGVSDDTLRAYRKELAEYNSQSPEKKSTFSAKNMKQFAKEYHQVTGRTLKDIYKVAKHTNTSFYQYLLREKAALEAKQDAQRRHTAPPTQPAIPHNASPSRSGDDESASE